MSIKQNGGVFGRNPTFNDVTIEGDLIINGEVFTGLDFQGSWNASTNTPSLASSVGTNGEFYIVSVAGTTDLNGITNWGIGDWAIFNGTAWQRVEGGADGNFNTLTSKSLSVNGTLGSVSVDTQGVFLSFSRPSASYIKATSATGYFQFQTGGSTTALILDTSPNASIPNGDLSVFGSISKGSGSFKIAHPLESKVSTHNLVHSFVESPQADNIYRGKINLSSGTATVNIDIAAGMTEGTFVALNRDIQIFTSNESTWDAVKGDVEGNIITILSKNSNSNATVSWMVIGERQDQHMYDTDWTDADGKVIVEPEIVIEPVIKDEINHELS